MSPSSAFRTSSVTSDTSRPAGTVSRSPTSGGARRFASARPSAATLRASSSSARASPERVAHARALKELLGASTARAACR